MSAIAQVIVTVQGRVQGVGYRAACAERARALGLRGWVRNRRDGTVEAFLAGPAPNVLRMREWMWEGPDAAQVTQVEVASAHGETLPPGFEVRPTL
ncbi:acylphosphatase [Ralstonia mannitolilytica]|uniref:acylphosphatase n=1 Tax=Ralstonia mannitolilytica TaxID=105219 RepID=A0AAJ4ZHQ4_9RALS|nr:acylphosphatase [Ralstonia mannitolilytica]AJW43721.1 acylphosphatase [Ralstonia mannitolilytica]MBU9579753.1 acylphosphatase [Ralstonia mannitolilytica]QIF08963.1 acylphosphatase [Ralstonia mannitolilytica]CAG2145652.1 Acylphosphatase [Ralstonia mannitolilytica]CAJ0728277.1 Acylphosphatase [Ralstonia mannitolilytica]